MFLLYEKEKGGAMKKHTKTKYGTASRRQPVKAGGFQENDVNSKRIFENPVLCSQFLREYSGLPALKNVKPEDIELIKVRYHIFTEAESNPDSVVRVWLKKERTGIPLYIVPLIDHKSSVDYNAGMQLLTYMVCIWKDWEKEMRDSRNLNCRNKDFRYPFVFPIVYYEGTDNWTADLHLSSRIFIGDTMKEYIPDFQYHLVRTHDFSNQELLEKKDEMSLLMILNKIQRAEDFSGFQNLMTEDIDTILEGTPESVVEILAGTTQSLCRKLNVPEDETNHYISKLREERKMGYLFENMEKMDIQLERRLRKEAQEWAKDAEGRLKAAEENIEETVKEAVNKAVKEAVKEAEEKQQNTEEKLKETEGNLKKAEENQRNAEANQRSAIAAYIELLQELPYTRAKAGQKLQEKFSMDKNKADELLDLYWKEE